VATRGDERDGVGSVASILALLEHHPPPPSHLPGVSLRWSDLDRLVELADHVEVGAHLRDVFPFPYTRADGVAFMSRLLGAPGESRNRPSAIHGTHQGTNACADAPKAVAPSEAGGGKEGGVAPDIVHAVEVDGEFAGEATGGGGGALCGYDGHRYHPACAVPHLAADVAAVVRMRHLPARL
jgi:hypothetical protein